MPRTIRNLRWWIIGLLMLGGTINYLTRSTLGVAAPTLIQDLGITTKQYSWIVATFQGALMTQPLAGYALDVIGLKVGFALFALAWSIISMAHALATNWQSFAVLRGMLGLAEGSANPAGMKATSEWFPAKERGLAGGFFNVGASVGSMLAPPLVVWAILHYGWRSAFVITGMLGLVWAAFWYWLYEPPDRQPRLSEEEREYIKAGQEEHLRHVEGKPSVGRIARARNFWGIAIPRFLADPTWGTLTFWVPLYLSTARGFDLKQIALFAWLPFLAADIGSVFGGVVAMALHRRGVSIVDARRWAFTLGALLMTPVAAVGFVRSPYLAIALISLAGFAHQTLSVTVITMSSDLFPQAEVGTATGVAGMAANLGVLIFTLVLGSLVDQVGYQPFFILLGVLDLAGALLLWTLIRKPA